MIKEKIVEDFGQPSFHVGAGVELFVGGESANKSLLDQVVGIGWTFCQVQCHSIQMVEVSHGLGRDGGALDALCFSLSGHGWSLTNCALSV